MTKCIQCGEELDEKTGEDWYTELGSGPYCESHYIMWQATDDRLKAEWDEYNKESN
jgi:hypothetical protein